MPLIYKIAPKSLWSVAQKEGRFIGAPIDIADGFIHFSTAEQVRETAAKHFVGQKDLVLAAIDVDVLGSGLRWEPSRGGALFPHLYRALLMSEVTSAHSIPLKADGSHDFEGLLP